MRRLCPSLIVPTFFALALCACSPLEPIPTRDSGLASTEARAPTEAESDSGIDPAIDPGAAGIRPVDENDSSPSLEVVDGGTSLRDLQRLARTRSPRVDALSARFAAADARVAQALSAFYPSLRSDGNFMRLEEEISFPNPGGGVIVVQDRDVYTQTTQLNYKLWDWGATKSSYRARLRDRDRENADRHRSLQLLDVQVANAIFGVREAEQDLEVLESSVKTLEGALKDVNVLLDVGRATRADVLVVQVQLERTRFEVRRVGDLVSTTRDQLSALLGDSRLGDIALRLDSEDLRRLPDDKLLAEQSLSALALARRPEFASLRAARGILENAKKAEQGAYLPQFDLFVQHEYSTTSSAFRNPQFFSGGVNVRWDLFSGFRTKHRVAELEAQVHELSANVAQLEIDAKVEIRAGLRAYERALDGVEVARVGVERAEENLRELRSLFDNGKASGQEMLEAESLLRTERARAVQARFQARRAWARLRFVCGLDFDEELVIRPEPNR